MLSLRCTIAHPPECILAERDGTLWTADARGGVMRIDADGSQRLIAQNPEGGLGADATPEQRSGWL
jgi:gluconolactonase